MLWRYDDEGLRKVGRRPESYNKGALPCRCIDLMRTHTLGSTALVLLAGLSTSAQQTAAANACRRRTAADHLQGRGQLRRDRRRRHRPAGQLRPQPDEGRFPVLEQGKPQTVVDLLARRHPGREVRSAALQGQADRARRPQQPQRVQRPRLRPRARRSATRTSRAPARVKAAARQFIERYLGANDVAAIVQTGGARGGSQEFTSSRERLLRASRHVHGAEGALRRRSSRSTTTTARAACRARRAAARSDRSDARLQGAQHASRC